MKALIRNEGESVTEDMDIPCINWKTGAPLTNPGWFGGPYILVDDYVPGDPDTDFVPTNPEPAATVRVNPDGSVPAGDTIVIDGVTYVRTS